MNDNENNKKVSGAIDELLNNINLNDKKKSKPIPRVWSSGISTTHLPVGFEFRQTFKDDTDNSKENSK